MTKRQDRNSNSPYEEMVVVSCEQLASFGKQSYAVRIRVIGRWQML